MGSARTSEMWAGKDGDVEEASATTTTERMPPAAATDLVKEQEPPLATKISSSMTISMLPMRGP